MICMKFTIHSKKHIEVCVILGIIFNRGNHANGSLTKHYYEGWCSQMTSIYRNPYRGFISNDMKMPSYEIEKDEFEAYKILLSEELMIQCVVPFEDALSDTLENALNEMIKSIEIGLFTNSHAKHRRKERIYG